MLQLHPSSTNCDTHAHTHDVTFWKARDVSSPYFVRKYSQSPMSVCRPIWSRDLLSGTHSMTPHCNSTKHYRFTCHSAGPAEQSVSVTVSRYARRHCADRLSYRTPCLAGSRDWVWIVELCAKFCKITCKTFEYYAHNFLHIMCELCRPFTRTFITQTQKIICKLIQIHNSAQSVITRTFYVWRFDNFIHHS